MRAIRAVYAISLLSFPILEARVAPQEALLTVVATAQGQTEITVSGRVTDEDGRPIVGARVQWGRSTARTDKNGNYSWRGTPTNSQWLILRVDHPEFPSIQSRIKLDTFTTLKQDFVLRTGGTVSGKVTTPDGPLLGVRISSRGSGLTRVWQSATTDPGGRYQIKLAEGNHTLVADHPDYAPASAPVSIEVGKTTVVDLVLTLAGVYKLRSEKAHKLCMGNRLRRREPCDLTSFIQGNSA